MMDILIDISILGFLAITAFGMLWFRDLFTVVILAGLYSLLSAVLFVVRDAVDVAFTEAAVGAGITTVLMLGTLALTSTHENPSRPRPIPILVVLLTGATLIYATLDMPGYGDPEAPVHQHVAPRYLRDTPSETGIPNVVTAVLASFRGYDTLGETTVIFAAGVGVLVLLGGGWQREKSDE